MSRETLDFKTTDLDGDITLVELSGALTLSNMFPLQAFLREPSTSKGWIIDLTNVEYMDSAGLGVLVNAHISCQKNHRGLVLVGTTLRVRTLLKITKVDMLFFHAANVEEAKPLILKQLASAQGA